MFWTFFWFVLLSSYVALALFLVIKSSRRNDSSEAEDPLKSGNTLLVISHPDDECMFFGPTVLKLCKNISGDSNDGSNSSSSSNSKMSNKGSLHLLCLSSGDHYGQGDLRKNELLDAAKCLRVNHVQIEDNPQLRDGHSDWDARLVSDLVSRSIRANSIDNVITFDGQGISGHTNHVAAFSALAILSKAWPSVNIYALQSVNMLRKYSSFLELPLTLLLHRNFICAPQATSSSRRRGASEVGRQKDAVAKNLIYSLNFSERRLLLKALYNHKSQMVWFRHLYATFSSYMFVNTLNKVF